MVEFLLSILSPPGYHYVIASWLEPRCPAQRHTLCAVSQKYAYPDRRTSLSLPAEMPSRSLMPCKPAVILCRPRRRYVLPLLTMLGIHHAASTAILRRGCRSWYEQQSKASPVNAPLPCICKQEWYASCIPICYTSKLSLVESYCIAEGE